MFLFSVTYEIVTPESAVDGDADERGFELEGASLRDAVACVCETRTNEVDGCAVEPSSSVIGDARWISVINGMEFRTGACETRSLHIPEGVSGASRARILKLIKGEV